MRLELEPYHAVICTKCACISNENPCWFCESPTVEITIPTEKFYQLKDEQEQSIMDFHINNTIKETYDHSTHLAMEARRRKNREKSLTQVARSREEEKRASQVTCPYCKSTNVKKLGNMDRALSFAAWGFASNKVGKNFKCKNCGSTF